MSASRPSASQSFKYYRSWVLQRYQSLHIYGKLFIWATVVFYICIGAFIFIVTPAKIAQYLYDKASALAEIRYGYLALGLAMFVASFPPLIGHTTLAGLCGFAYGMNGFFISAAASVMGSAAVFVILRYLFSERIRRWTGQNKKWQALESVINAKGLPLIVLIRISPLPPWVYSNTLFASIETVSLWQFVFATCFIFPKLALHAFIGSRMASLSDGHQRGGMDGHTIVLNAVLILSSLLIVMFTSWVIYTLVQGHLAKLESSSSRVERDTEEEYDEEAPLLSD
ncbi:hypothetical protein Agabi119p4_4634 [Agaricus bisporus var. burnettii]|uniref:Golgi apparatus membrane protein TVP38 n=1 Tax=Agaricus bisporus var. burnettii TaxID=192524 RepID=A0A8H7F3M5_AGABI|nr:hypothetical protein AGABI2DRAFT_191787 [Agaricus bisporus var. bisporus H97]EKV48150.1 hypothetical protein AGABI2DRAFT_191787 [Agaricus bisporus var. bisporus H97]KAF7776241.1 hypothetical protein Agabi119p4_4634 [Agaricus bisporus var. burnettii]